MFISCFSKNILTFANLFLEVFPKTFEIKAVCLKTIDWKSFNIQI